MRSYCIKFFLALLLTTYSFHEASYKGPDTGDFVGSLLEAVSPITIYCEAYVEREKIKEVSPCLSILFFNTMGIN